MKKENSTLWHYVYDVEHKVPKTITCKSNRKSNRVLELKNESTMPKVPNLKSIK